MPGADGIPDAGPRLLEGEHGVVTHEYADHSARTLADRSRHLVRARRCASWAEGRAHLPGRLLV